MNVKPVSDLIRKDPENPLLTAAFCLALCELPPKLSD